MRKRFRVVMYWFRVLWRLFIGVLKGEILGVIWEFLIFILVRIEFFRVYLIFLVGFGCLL